MPLVTAGGDAIRISDRMRIVGHAHHFENIIKLEKILSERIYISKIEDYFGEIILCVSIQFFVLFNDIIFNFEI